MLGIDLNIKKKKRKRAEERLKIVEER